ncbi:MAG: type II toxin-antitoxin system VapB family antitoxin [Candidatus Brocadiales bacterium]
MRTTLDIDVKLLEEAMRLTRAKSKKETIDVSLKELIRQRRRERLLSRLGRFRLDLTLKKLERLRRGE